MSVEKRIKRFDGFDIFLIKISSMAFILFVITLWPAAMSLIQSINPWYILLISALLAFRPSYRFFK